MEGHLLMSAKERLRKSVFEEVAAGRRSLREASESLKLSYRQCRRLYKRFREQGDGGLLHVSRGRVSNRRKCPELRDQAISRYRERYAGWGATLAAEKLAEEGILVDHETLRRWLLASGDLERRRKRRAYRSRRERRHHFGELVQMDGSHHRWFGQALDQACLINMVDDATGLTLGFMDEQETTRACMIQLWQWIANFGIPRALYTDKKTVFVTSREATLEEQLAGLTPKTAFGMACEKLGIEIIEANSPQAKGRVERNHGVYQDRFVKELALSGAVTVEQANAVLADGYLDNINAKFARPPASMDDYHRPVSAGVNLADVFCFEEVRTVQNDWVIRHDNKHYQIGSDNKPLPKPKDKIVVRTRLDATLHILYKDKPLRYQQLADETVRQRDKEVTNKARQDKKIVALKPRKSSKSPWRQGVSLMFADPVKQPNKT